MPNVGKEKSRKIRKIRDVIHDYVDITSIEENLINSKEFQRLRYISQNSLAYYTYPSNTTNRFSHSLGVMHIGGLLFAKALENSNSETLLSFLAECEKLIREICQENYNFEELAHNWIELFGNISDFNHHPIDLTKPEWLDFNQIACLNIMWQAVRIACMIHDIGHFPFSHLFEHALDNFINQKVQPTDKGFGQAVKANVESWKEEYKIYLTKLNVSLGARTSQMELINELPSLHEIQGVLILRSYLPQEDPVNKDPIKDLSLLCLKLGKAIFIHNKSGYETGVKDGRFAVLDSMHTIVSSEIDADRLDYCMRDPNASGLELGAYDLKRIIDSIILQKEKSNSFRIVFSINGLSGIESFFHQRFLMYEYLIYHHNVARFDGTLEHTIGLLFELYPIDEEIKDIIIDFGLIKEVKSGSYVDVILFRSFDFSHYDDYWLKTLLNKIYIRLNEKIENGKKKTHGFSLNGKIKELYTCLEIVLFRSSYHIYTLWKRRDDFISDLNTIISGVGSNPEIPEHVSSIITSLNKLTHNDKATIERRQKIEEELRSKGLFFIIKGRGKKIFDEKIENQAIIQCGEHLKPAHEVSLYLNSLKYNIENSIHFNIFIIGTEIRRNNDLKAFAKEVLIKNLTEFIIIKNN